MILMMSIETLKCLPVHSLLKSVYHQFNVRCTMSFKKKSSKFHFIIQIIFVYLYYIYVTVMIQLFKVTYCFWLIGSKTYLCTPLEARRAEALPTGNVGCISIFAGILIKLQMVLLHATALL